MSGLLNISQSVVSKQFWRAEEASSFHPLICFRTDLVFFSFSLYAGISINKSDVLLYGKCSPGWRCYHTLLKMMKFRMDNLEISKIKFLRGWWNHLGVLAIVQWWPDMVHYIWCCHLVTVIINSASGEQCLLTTVASRHHASWMWTQTPQPRVTRETKRTKQGASPSMHSIWVHRRAGENCIWIFILRFPAKTNC